MLQGCSEQIVLEGQDLPRTNLACHELENVIIIIIITVIIHAIAPSHFTVPCTMHAGAPDHQGKQHGKSL